MAKQKYPRWKTNETSEASPAVMRKTLEKEATIGVVTLLATPQTAKQMVISHHAVS